MSAVEFSAVLLAGGRSRRMGRDKALLPMPGDGRVLWQRQLEDVLHPLRPAELFLSGPARDGLPKDITILPDVSPEEQLGPLAGIAAALSAMRTPLLIVLAIDLPLMTAEFFRDELLPHCRSRKGTVPCGEDGFFEPLAAIYPRECHALASAQLRNHADRSLQSFVRAARDEGLVALFPITESNAPLFANWNTPEDLNKRPT